MKFVGALIGTASGSMGGATASHNRGGQYMRQRVVPTNPATTRQTMVRAYLGAANGAYGMLTAPQKAAWETFAQNMPRTDSLGNTIVLTGQQMYCGMYVPAMLAGMDTDIGGPTVFNNGVSPVSFASLNQSLPGVFGVDGVNMSIASGGPAASSRSRCT